MDANPVPQGTGLQPAAPRRASIRALLILLVAAATLPLMGLLAYMSYAEWVDDAADATLTLKALAVQTARSAAIPVRTAERITRFMAGRAALRALDPSACDPALDDLLRQNLEFANIGTVDAAGNAVCTVVKSTGTGRANIGAPPWFGRLKAERRFIVGAPQKGIYTGQWIAVTAHPILEGDRVVGAAQVMLKLAALGEFTAGLALPPEAVTGIVSREGVVIARSRDGAAWVGRDVSATPIGRAVVEGRLDTAVHENSEGRAHLYAFEPIAGTDWVAIAGLPDTAVFAPARAAAWRNVLAGALVLLLAALLVRMIHRRIADPLEALAAVARDVGAGDMRRRVAPSGPKELIDTAATFNGMLDRIPQMEERLRASESHYRKLFETSPDALRVVCDGRVVMANPAAEALYGGSTGASIVGSESTATIHPDFRNVVPARFTRVLSNGETVRVDDQVLRRLDGTDVHVAITLLPFEFEGRPAVLSCARDLTAQRAADERIARLLAFKSVLSRVNQSIAQSSEWAPLCAEVCRIIVETGGVALAAIRVCDAERAILLPFAHHGPELGRIGRRPLPLSETAHPAVRAFRSGEGSVIDDIAGEPSLADSHEPAREFGIGSAVMLAIRHHGVSIGTLSVFAAPAGHFDADLTALLTEVAANLAFAHAKLAGEAHQRESDERYRVLFNASPDAIRIFKNGRVLLANSAAVGLFGEAATGAVLAAVHPDYRQRHDERIAQVLATQAPLRTDDLQMLRADGSAAWAELVLTPLSYDGTPAVMCIVRDVTARKATETILQRLARLKATLGMVHEAINRERDWSALCDRVCRIAVEQGGVASARIRIHNPATDALDECASAGPGTCELSCGVVMAGTSMAPPALAFRQGKPLLINDIEASDMDPATRADVLGRGIRATAVLPLMSGGRAFGTFSVFAGETRYFDPELAEVLGEIADSLAFAHEKLAVDRAFAQASARLAAVVDFAMDAIVTIDAGLRVVVFNRAAEAVFRMPAESAIGQSILQFVPARFRTDNFACMLGVVKESSATQAAGGSRRIQALRADGTEFPADASISRVEVDGETFHTLIMHDISERIEAQREVAEAQTRYRSLVENSTSGVGLFEGYRFQFANARMAVMLGVADPQDLIGVDVLDFVPQKWLTKVKDSFRRRHENRRADLPPIRMQLRSRSGDIIDIEAIGTVIELGGRELLQAEIRDVTRELRAFEEIRELNRGLEARVEQRTAALSEMNRQLNRANADLEAFSYTAAHDLRAPVRAMSGFAELITYDVADGKTEDLAAHAARIVRNAEKMNALIDGLLAVARTSHDEILREPVAFGALVEEVLADTGARGRAQVSVGALPVVEADTVAMRQVWTNLVSNALKYSAKRAYPAIAIDCTRGISEIAFHVRDNGCGFDPAYAERLFGTFQRLHAATEFEGNGVGLAIVRGLVERHGGRVWAEGAVGEGATFHFALPIERLVRSENPGESRPVAESGAAP